MAYRGMRLSPDHQTWKRGFELLQAALKTPIESKKLQRIIKKPLSSDVAPELFEYSAYLVGLGRMSLSMFPASLLSRFH